MSLTEYDVGRCLSGLDLVIAEIESGRLGWCTQAVAKDAAGEPVLAHDRPDKRDRVREICLIGAVERACPWETREEVTGMLAEIILERHGEPWRPELKPTLDELKLSRHWNVVTIFNDDRPDLATDEERLSLLLELRDQLEAIGKAMTP